VNFDDSCKDTGAYTPLRPQVSFNGAAGLRPGATSAQITLTQIGTGKLLYTFTLTAGTPSKVVQVGYGNWILKATVKLADGRTVTDQWTQPTYTPGTCPVNQITF
jgi:hypothetical protein